MKRELQIAVEAAESKKAEEVVVLDVRKLCSFTDFFIVCGGSNPRQVQAIADEIELCLKKHGDRAHHIEGYSQAEWVLMDYVNFVVHVFSEKARVYYDLERLWRAAPKVKAD